MTERDFALFVLRRLQEAGFRALWAGGCVRDELLGLEPADYDVATDAVPDQVRKLFSNIVETGAAYGVLRVIGPKQKWGYPTVEVAAFRTDVDYTDGRRPTSVIYSTPEEDAKRRDFTINGMFSDPIADKLFDFVGGRADLDARILRAIGNPIERFTEDKLRMLRAVRFATRFEMSIEPATEAAIRMMAREIDVVSAERIAKELRGCLVDRHRAAAMRLFLDLGLADVVMPELVPMRGLPQGRPHAPTGDLWDHVLRTLALLGPGVSFELAMGGLLHDVGKPRTVGRTTDRYTFYGHEHVGARMADDIARRLRLANDERERIAWLVDKHQVLADARAMRPSKLKVLLGHEGIRELLDLHRADALASDHGVEHVEYCEFLLGLWTDDVLHPAPLLTGHDLTRLGYKPGPQFKVWLDAVREAQLDGTISTREAVLELIERLRRESGDPA